MTAKALGTQEIATLRLVYAPKHCQTERCRKIYYSGHQRTKCGRCGDPLARGRAAQRAAICGRCFVDLVDLAGGGAQ